MWCLSVAPETLEKLVEILNHSDFVPLAEDRSGKERGIVHSLSILDISSSSRPNFFEIFLTSEETRRLLTAYAKCLAKSNPDGSKLLQEYAKMF